MYCAWMLMVVARSRRAAPAQAAPPDREHTVQREDLKFVFKFVLDQAFPL